MQLITTRNKENSFAELKKAISSGNGLELIRRRQVRYRAQKRRARQCRLRRLRQREARPLRPRGLPRG